MNDSISRQAAIDAIGILLEQSEDDEHDKIWNNAIRGSINAVKHHLPSAQPEIIRCENCKHWEGEKRGQFWYFEQCSLHQCTASGNDFCSWAERRTDEGD